MLFFFFLKFNVNNVYEDKNGDLIFLNVQIGDVGVYICKVSNLFGMVSFVVILVVYGNLYNLYFIGYLFYCYLIYFILFYFVGIFNLMSICNKYCIVYKQ